MPVTQKMLIERCRTIAGEKGKWTADDLGGFLHRFRPKGDGLTELLKDVEGGEAIAKRLASVIQADGTTAGMQLFVAKPKPTTEENAIKLVKRFLGNQRLLAQDFGEEELFEKLMKIKTFSIVAKPTKSFRENSKTTDLVSHICDFVEGLVFDGADRSSNAAFALTEAVYTLTYDFFLQYYVLWPMLGTQATKSDAFLPYFEMWRHGIKWRLGSNAPVEICLPAK